MNQKCLVVSRKELFGENNERYFNGFKKKIMMRSLIVPLILYLFIFILIMTINMEGTLVQMRIKK